MKGKILITVLLLGGIIAFLGGAKTLQFGAMMAQAEKVAPPPEAVATAVVAPREWQPELNAVGSLSPVQGVMIKAELSGVVREVGFENGATVKKGDLLVRLDTDLEEAQLQSAEAQAGLARLDFERAKRLKTDKTIAQAELDTVESRHKQADAAVAALRATISKKTITAPFSGRAGIRKVNVGQFVEVGNPIVPLQSVDPIYADFHLPQQRLADLRPDLAVNLQTDAFEGRTFSGKLSAINTEVDEATRNVHLQATIPNPDGLLRPGMFVRTAVLLPGKKDLLTIPATSVLYAPYGNSVYAIEAGPNGGKVVRQRFVRLGPSIGDFVAVVEGLKEGEEIVAAGAFKLRGGMAVSVNNTIAPPSSVHPKPDDT